ncbi:MAG: alpha/beta fold hydrolase [Sinobacteraceae bacterium]|nr:alpha/beta fold hydrolase [Nevskiaceae bacterium]
MLWYQKGGAGTRAILLLHGLGATSAVWCGVQRTLEERGIGRWIAPDLSGHGRSDPLPHYSIEELATELASLVRDEPELFVIGHSLGAYLGLALASASLGAQIRGVLAIGPKVSWPPADVQFAQQLAARPVRWFANGEEAAKYYRRVSGLDPQIAPGEEWLRHGIVQQAAGWRLSQDSRTFEVAGAPFEPLIARAQAHILLARGEHDSMVSTFELRQFCDRVEEIATAGHNAHVESSEAVVTLFELLM